MINPLAWSLFFIGTIPTSIFEEVVFRGIYWKYMLMKYGRKGSLALVHALNGLLFAGIHLPRIFFEYVDTLYAGELPFMGLSILFNGLIFVLNGFILSLLRDTFKNLIAPIVYHIVLNILVVTIQFNRFYMLLFTFMLLVITLAINLLRPINPSEPPQEKVAPGYKENVLNTPEHEWFRLAYYVGNGLIVLFALFMISTGDIPDMIISAVVAIPALLAVGYVYGKRLWLFSYL
ncbi:CPBP family intramembrane metalloprotease [Candidatus Bathyarchaeota archaeon]|nr:CPBP family intramembrane metalloprotease [Candidatus Bathyarchaeota archaeon]